MVSDIPIRSPEELATCFTVALLVGLHGASGTGNCTGANPTRTDLPSGRVDRR